MQDQPLQQADRSDGSGDLITDPPVGTLPIGAIRRGPRSGPNARAREIVATVLAALLLSGCVGQLPGIVDRAGFYLINDTTQPVQVFYLKDGALGRAGRVAADDTEVFSLDLFDSGNDENCTTGVLIVRSLDGREVARIPPPICDQQNVELSVWGHR